VGLKPILRTTTSFSALTLLVGSFDPQKPVPDMTYNVFCGTLGQLFSSGRLNMQDWKCRTKLDQRRTLITGKCTTKNMTRKMRDRKMQDEIDSYLPRRSCQAQ